MGGKTTSARINEMFSGGSGAGGGEAENKASLVPDARAPQLFSAFCNLCPTKHCGIEKYMGATGNIICRRLSEIRHGE